MTYGPAYLFLKVVEQVWGVALLQIERKKCSGVSSFIKQWVLELITKYVLYNRASGIGDPMTTLNIITLYTVPVLKRSSSL